MRILCGLQTGDFDQAPLRFADLKLVCAHGPIATKPELAREESECKP